MGRPGRARRPAATPRRTASRNPAGSAAPSPISRNTWGMPVSSHRGKQVRSRGLGVLQRLVQHPAGAPASASWARPAVAPHLVGPEGGAGGHDSAWRRPAPLPRSATGASAGRSLITQTPLMVTWRWPDVQLPTGIRHTGRHCPTRETAWAPRVARTGPVQASTGFGDRPRSFSRVVDGPPVGRGDDRRKPLHQELVKGLDPFRRERPPRGGRASWR